MWHSCARWWNSGTRHRDTQRPSRVGVMGVNLRQSKTQANHRRGMEIAQAMLLSVAAIVMIVAGLRLSHFVGEREEIAADQRRWLVECGLLCAEVTALRAEVAELRALIPRPEQ